MEIVAIIIIIAIICILIAITITKKTAIVIAMTTNILNIYGNINSISNISRNISSRVEIYIATAI